MNHYITMNDLHIEDSYLVKSEGEMNYYLDLYEHEMPESEVWKRSYGNLRREWITHNFLYYLHLFRSRTKDVDLNYPQSFIEKVVYTIIGGLCSIFFLIDEL